MADYDTVCLGSWVLVPFCPLRRERHATSLSYWSSIERGRLSDDTQPVSCKVLAIPVPGSTVNGVNLGNVL